MNERIKELATQVDACYIPRYDMWQMDTETMEKFAELIIRECVSQCEFYDDSNWGPASECIARDIKRHFGVEE